MKKVISSIKWNLTLSVIRRSGVAILSLYIARCLDKDDLGLFEVFIRAITFTVMVATLSTEYLYVIRKKAEEFYFSRLAKTTLAVSAVFSVLFFFSAVPVSIYMKDDRFIEIFRYFAIFVFLYSIRKIAKTYLQKKLMFKQFSLFETFNVILYSTLILISFRFKASYWLLFLCFLAGDLFEVILLLTNRKSSIVSKIKKSLAIKTIPEDVDKKKDRKFLRVTTITHIIGFVCNNFMIIYLGHAFSVAEIGVFGLAGKMIKTPVSFITTAIKNVFFPSFSQMTEEERNRGINNYLFAVTGIFWALLAWFVFFLVKVIPFILGDKWAEALPVMVILALNSATLLFVNPISSIPVIMEKAQYELYWRIFTLLTIIIGVFAGSHFGFKASLIGYVAATFISHLTYGYIIFRLLKLSYKIFISKLLINGSAIMLLIAGFYFIKDFSLIYSLALSVLLTFIYLFTANLLTKNRIYLMLRKFI